jgi:hypothetical protein
MSDAPEQIQRRMEAVRCDLARDVDDVVRSAGRLVDWREYVRRYPWACLGAAAAVGYLLVPKRPEIINPDADTLLELAKRNELIVNVNPAPQKWGGVTSTLFTLAAKAAVRGAVSYVSGRMARAAGERASGSDGAIRGHRPDRRSMER